MRKRGSKSNNKKDRLRRDNGITPIDIYKRLRKSFGFQDWWPGETDFEILVGAILTQQTTWANVEKAISNLKRENVLEINSIVNMETEKLEGLIRSSGFYRQKARRLKSVCKSITDEFGGLGELFEIGTNELRGKLLSYNGIGKETADSIILYAANQPVFVIDAYTKRIMGRVHMEMKSMDYDALQRYFEENIKPNLTLYKDFHAQIVELGKRNCKSKPLCETCPLRNACEYNASGSKVYIPMRPQ